MSVHAPARRAAPARQCVALELGTSAIRAVEVEWSGEGGQDTARLLRRGAAPLPANIWTDLTANRDAAAAAIRQALASAGITTRSVVACLPRRLVTLRFARLPHAPPEQMRSMVAFEAQQYILFSLDEIVLDYHVLPEPLPGFTAPGDSSMETVLLAGARRSLVADIMGLFDRAGLELERLTVSALGLAELAQSSAEPTAVVDLEPGDVDVAVVAKGRLLFTRASALDIDAMDPDTGVRRLAEELARSFTSFENDFRQLRLDRVFLTGPGAASGGSQLLMQGLSELLEAPVERLQSRLLPPGDPDTHTYATALGVALQTHPSGLATINLVPDERAIRRAHRARQRRQAGVALAATTVVGLLALLFWFTATSRAALQKKTLIANAELSETTERLEARRKTHDKVEALVKEVALSLDHDHPAVDVLVAINEALPRSSSLWLTQLTFDRGIEATGQGRKKPTVNELKQTMSLTMRGETRSASAATDLVLALQKSGAFSRVRLNYVGDSQDPTHGQAAVGQSLPGVAPSARRGRAPAAGSMPVARTSNPTGTNGAGTGPKATVTTPTAPSSNSAGSKNNAVGDVQAKGSSTNERNPRNLSPLTSFIITCQVNLRRKDLVPPSIASATRPQNERAGGAGPGRARKPIDSADEEMPEESDSNAESQ